MDAMACSFIYTRRKPRTTLVQRGAKNDGTTQSIAKGNAKRTRGGGARLMRRRDGGDANCVRTHSTERRRDVPCERGMPMVVGVCIGVRSAKQTRRRLHANTRGRSARGGGAIERAVWWGGGARVYVSQDRSVGNPGGGVNSACISKRDVEREVHGVCTW
jgi:hypothetical protein